MTQTFGVNANNDIYIGANGNLVILQGQAAVGAACASASRASLGEEVLATTSGIPFFQAIFVGVPNLQAANAALIQTLEQVDGVISVTSVTSSITKNALGKAVWAYVATIESEYGLIFTISAEIVSP